MDMAPGSHPRGVVSDLAGRPGAAGLAAAAGTLAAGRGTRAVVLVEGISDKVALEVLADRRGRDLAGEGVVVVAMGGATAAGAFLEHVGPHGLGLRTAGLCDVREEGVLRRALERAGLGSGLDRGRMEELGFAVCVVDLEDELIRSLGTAAVEDVVARQGDGGPLRTFLRQPAQQGRGRDAQLRRFLGTRSGRKLQYAALLVDALDLDAVPRPLDLVLAHVAPEPS